jgi:hypothetical protein
VTLEPPNKEAPDRRGRGIASLILLLGALFLIGWALKKPFQTMVAARLGHVVWLPIVKSIKSSDLAHEQHKELCSLLDSVSADFRAKKLSESQLYDLSMKLSRRYLAKLVRLQAAQRRLLENSRFTDAKKNRINTVFQRFSQAVIQRKIRRRRVRTVYEQWRDYGHRDKDLRPSDSELEQLLLELQAYADGCKIPKEVKALDLISEFKKAIDESYQ